ncbi:MAG: hypothetical protein ABJB66_08480 [Gemmatimonadaceae bacterium]
MRDATSVANALARDAESLRKEDAGSNPGKSGFTTHLEIVRDLARRVDADAELRRYLAQPTPTPT